MRLHYIEIKKNINKLVPVPYLVHLTLSTCHASFFRMVAKRSLTVHGSHEKTEAKKALVLPISEKQNHSQHNFWGQRKIHDLSATKRKMIEESELPVTITKTLRRNRNHQGFEERRREAKMIDYRTRRPWPYTVDKMLTSKENTNIVAKFECKRYVTLQVIEINNTEYLLLLLQLLLQCLIKFCRH